MNSTTGSRQSVHKATRLSAALLWSDDQNKTRENQSLELADACCSAHQHVNDGELLWHVFEVVLNSGFESKMFRILLWRVTALSRYNGNDLRARWNQNFNSGFVVWNYEMDSHELTVHIRHNLRTHLCYRSRCVVGCVFFSTSSGKFNSIPMTFCQWKSSLELPSLPMLINPQFGHALGLLKREMTTLI